MKPFAYFALGVSVTVNIVMAIDYCKKSRKLKILMEANRSKEK